MTSQHKQIIFLYFITHHVGFGKAYNKGMTGLIHRCADTKLYYIAVISAYLDH